MTAATFRSARHAGPARTDIVIAFPEAAMRDDSYIDGIEPDPADLIAESIAEEAASRQMDADIRAYAMSDRIQEAA